MAALPWLRPLAIARRGADPRETERRAILRMLPWLDPHAKRAGVQENRVGAQGPRTRGGRARATPSPGGVPGDSAEEDGPAKQGFGGLEAGLVNPSDGGDTWTVRAPVTRYGINLPKFFRSEEGRAGGTNMDRASGTYEAIADDLALLGAAVGRHPGELQLYLEDLLSHAPVPFYTDPDDLAPEVAASPIFDDLYALIVYLSANDIPLTLYFTGITAGSVTETRAEPSMGGLGPPPAQPTRLAWNEQYLGERGFSTNHGADWDLDTLGPWSHFKRRRLAAMARGIAMGLNRVQRRLMLLPSAPSLADYIEGVELGNELEARDQAWNSTTDAFELDGASWGAFYYECAAAMVDEAPWLPIKLPALTSAGGAALPQVGAADWSTKLEFLSEMLAEVERRAAVDGVDAGDLVTGADLHYYHREAGVDAQRMSFLVAEVAELRAEVARFSSIAGIPITVQETAVGVACALPAVAPLPPSLPTLEYDAGCEASDNFTVRTPYPEYVAPSGPDADLRPIIAECALTWDPIEVPDPEGDPVGDFEPPAAATEVSDAPDQEWYPDGERVGPNDFQAMSVWMRLAVAAVAGAEIVGWHTLMASLDTGFAGTGLRRDLHESTELPEVALQRPSWWAYQRYVQLLGGASEVAALLPSRLPTTERAMQEEVESGNGAAYDIWAVEFTRPVRTPATTVQSDVAALHVPAGLPRGWAYLLFIDPYGDTNCATVTLTSSGSGTHTVVQVATQPLAATLPSYTAPGFLPASTWTAVSERSHTCGPSLDLEVSLTAGRYPVLLFSSQELTVRSVEVS